MGCSRMWFGVGVIGACATFGPGLTAPAQSREAKAPRGVVRAELPKADPQTRIAILRIARDAGHSSHDVRADAIRRWYRGRYRAEACVPLITALSVGRPRSREFAARALGELMLPNAVRPLASRALADREATVRRSCVASLARMHRRWPDVVADPFVRALDRTSLATRARAVDALGAFRHEAAIPVLIREFEYIGGRGPRVNVFAGRQVAYVRDYDAEVATGAAIAKPNVGVVQSGAVLDTRVLQTRRVVREYHRVVARALRSITGARFGPDRAAWTRWLRARKKAQDQG